MPKLPLVQILSHLDLHALGERAMVLSAPGPEGAVKTRAEVVSQIVDEVDALIPFHLFPPWGTVVDLLDGPVVKLLVNLILMIGQARKHKPESSVHADLKAHVDAAIAEADAGHSKKRKLGLFARAKRKRADAAIAVPDAVPDVPASPAQGPDSDGPDSDG